MCKQDDSRRSTFRKPLRACGSTARVVPRCFRARRRKRVWGTSRAPREQKFYPSPARDAELKRVLPHIDSCSDGYMVAARIEVRSLAGDLRGRRRWQTKKRDL